MPPSVEALDAWFDYDPATGVLSRKGAREECGYLDHYGYKIVRLAGREYKAHRIAWALLHGNWPSNYIDHINGDPADNRAANLRLASHSANLRNSGLRRDSTSGYRGVSLSRSRKKWNAQVHLGTFDSAEEAAAAVQHARELLFGAGASPNMTNPSLSARVLRGLDRSRTDGGK